MKPVQFYGRLWYRYWRPKLDLNLAPNVYKPIGAWSEPARRLSSMHGPLSFIFLNEPGHLKEIGWDGPQRDKLWRYNQHYFDDLNAKEAHDRKVWHEELIQNWIDNNPPVKGNGWESYPLSLRIVNWIKWALRKEDLSDSALQSLAIQLRWLYKRMEVYLLGNHLLANAKALVFGGLFFEGKEADIWLSKGLGILLDQIDEQILPDGGHFERSSMYHALVLEDVLDLINITKCFSSRLSCEQKKLSSSWSEVAVRMYFWLDTMCHPDGEISFFNDSAFDIAPKTSELEAYAKRVLSTELKKSKCSIIHHVDSGYMKIIKKNESVAFLDIARLGPDYLPGHAHADTLTFEWSIGKQRVIVNSGTSCYGSSEERLQQRGTAAHNTVVIDGHDSSEVWGGFRVARRAYPIELQISQSNNNETTEVQCAHNGYFRLPGKPKHRRRWRMDEESILIEDQMNGSTASAHARFHFHPDVFVRVKDEKSGTIQIPNSGSVEWEIMEGVGVIEASSWHPRFGVTIPNVCLAVKLIKGVSKISFRYSNS